MMISDSSSAVGRLLFPISLQSDLVTGLVSRIQTDNQLGLFTNLALFVATVIIFSQPVSFPLRLERVDHWEPTASRGDRPSHLIS